ncbi:hypothetical protein CHS0354_012459 [Potamilus streckersoni]|uniref:DZF domain-containing protein n=1 Tax=Potamilus streckersoni TaxID=2493646 RepID=A0AAE0RUS4_9BIVA|nr:hypothetical protein CHS0354_012459 [Potamilus streckersoni]
MGRPGSTPDDRHAMAKHTAIYPTEDELQSVQNLVTACEKALKSISDALAELDHPKDGAKKEAEEKKEKVTNGDKEESKEGDEKDKEKAVAPPRVLKGVMRVGVLADGLLLRGNLEVDMVLLCSDKPTRTLLSRIVRMLPEQLTAAAPDEKFSILPNVSKAAIVVTNAREHKAVCTITLTSASMREDPPEGVTVKDPPDVLDRQKCLDALAAVRHAKWFQARANGLQSCVIVLRILRDMCRRIPTWAPLTDWALDLLVEKALGSFRYPLWPGYALRRVFDSIANGVLLPNGPGLLDPCEKDVVDASGNLTNQEREDITASAQHCVRLIAFRQIFKVLGIDPLPPPQRYRDRKRKIEEGNDVEEKKEKIEGEQTEQKADVGKEKVAASTTQSK